MPFRIQSLAGMNLAGEDLRELPDGCDLSGATLRACVLGTLAGARLVGTRLVDSDLRAITLAGALIDDTRFVRCVFDERGVKRVSPYVAGPYAIVAPYLEWNAGVRGQVTGSTIEIGVWMGSPDGQAPFEVVWRDGNASYSATVMHMSVLFGYQEHGHKGAGAGGAVAFDEVLRDGPPDSWQMPAALWQQLRAAIEARLPRWRPPVDPG